MLQLSELNHVAPVLCIDSFKLPFRSAPGCVSSSPPMPSPLDFGLDESSNSWTTFGVTIVSCKAGGRSLRARAFERLIVF